MTERAIPPHSIRRAPRARRPRLTVTPDGALVVVLPPRVPERAAAQLVAEHLDWVERQLGRAAARRVALASRPPLLAGRRITVHGIPCTVRLAAAGERREGGRVGAAGVERRLAADDEGITGELVIHPGRGRHPPVAILEAWLRGAARTALQDRVAARAPAMEVTPRRLTVRAQSTRWGSASADGSLSFNWRLLLAPPFVLDSVVVHELAHLRVRGHGPRFWALVQQHAPRTDEARAWLRAHHAELLAALE